MSKRLLFGALASGIALAPPDMAEAKTRDSFSPKQLAQMDWDHKQPIRGVEKGKMGMIVVRGVEVGDEFSLSGSCGPGVEARTLTDDEYRMREAKLQARGMDFARGVEIVSTDKKTGKFRLRVRLAAVKAGIRRLIAAIACTDGTNAESLVAGFERNGNGHFSGDTAADTNDLPFDLRDSSSSAPGGGAKTSATSEAKGTWHGEVSAGAIGRVPLATSATNLSHKGNAGYHLTFDAEWLSANRAGGASLGLDVRGFPNSQEAFRTFTGEEGLTRRDTHCLHVRTGWVARITNLFRLKFTSLLGGCMRPEQFTGGVDHDGTVTILPSQSYYSFMQDLTLQAGHPNFSATVGASAGITGADPSAVADFHAGVAGRY